MNGRRILAYGGSALAGAVLARGDVASILAGAFQGVMQSPTAVGGCLVLIGTGVIALTGIGVPREPEVDDISSWSTSDAYQASTRVRSDCPMGVGLARPIGKTPPLTCRTPGPFPDGPGSQEARDFASAMRALDACTAVAIELHGRTGTTTYLDRIGDAVDRDGRIDAGLLSIVREDMAREHPFVAVAETDARSPRILSAYGYMVRRTRRTIPTIHVWWMKRIDRSLWYAFLNVGRGADVPLWPEGIELSDRIEIALANAPSLADDALSPRAIQEMKTVPETATTP